jgi:hypothetical protein
MPSWLYFNPSATHPLYLNVALFREHNPHRTYDDWFTHEY